MRLGGLATFQPAPNAIDQLIDDLGNPEATIASLAAAHHTTTEALCLWMAQPDIAERIAQSNNIITWRTRLVASSALPSIVSALTKILNNFNTAHSAQREPNPPAAPATRTDASSDSRSSALHALRSSILDWRAAETTRKSCQILLRLANLSPVGLPRPLRPADEPADAAESTTTPAPTPRPSAHRSTAPGRSTHNAPRPENHAPPPSHSHPDDAPDASDHSARRDAASDPETSAASTHPAPADFEPPADAVAQLEEIFFNILEHKPHLEPALNRFVAEIQQADQAIRTHPP